MRERKDAVLLTDREYRGSRRLRSAPELRVIHTTTAYPSALVVAFGNRLDERTDGQLTRAVTGLSRDAEGKKLLEEMGIEGFQDADRTALAALEKRYEDPKSTGQPR